MFINLCNYFILSKNTFISYNNKQLQPPLRLKSRLIENRWHQLIMDDQHL